MLLITVFSNGLLLGLSWDSLPSLSPTLGADSQEQLMQFLIGYSVSTAGTMGLITLIIALCALIVGKITDSASSLPSHLSRLSSYLSLALGGVWVLHGVVHAVAGIDDHMPEMALWVWAAATLSPLLIVLVILYAILKEFGLWGNIYSSDIKKFTVHASSNV